MNNIEKTTNVIIEGKELSSSISFLFNISIAMNFAAKKEIKTTAKSKTAKTYLYLGYFIIMKIIKSDYLQFLKNIFILSQINPICSSLSSGNIGRDKQLAAKPSVTGKSPFLYPRCSKHFCKCKGTG